MGYLFSFICIFLFFFILYFVIKSAVRNAILEARDLEDYEQEPNEDGNHIAIVTCPNCGRKHEMDDPSCLYCKQRDE